MYTQLRALIVEDSEDDALLLVRELTRGGHDVTFERVDTPEALAEALEHGGWDIVFADYTMPRLRGTEALAMVRQQGHDLPFMFVSGTIGEDVAVEAMKAGADDYVIKGNLKRLLPAVARELRDAAVRRERNRSEAERGAAEEALRVSEERQRLLFEHIADAILVFDRDGIIRFASPSVRDVIGYEPDELTGRPALELVHPDDAAGARESLAQVTRRPGALQTVELRMRHRDGSWRVMEAALQNLVDHPDIAGLVVTARDVTERKRLEAEFLQAQKLKSVGRLASGIAHDFNNLLTVIAGETQLSLARPLEPPLQESLAAVQRAAERGALLTRQLLAFSRKQIVESTLFDLNELVADTEKLLQRLIGEDVTLAVRPAPEPTVVRADQGQIEQVLMNLAVNARDAMPRGGTLTIETARAQLGSDDPRVGAGIAPGDYALLTVTDTGTGMSEEVKAHLFEPFFTTKEEGMGTGLGLATSYGIVKQSGGHITVDSELDRGTAVRVYLPLMRGEARTRRTPPGTAVLAGTETILLVEDDDRVREVATRSLETYGYRVFAAADGAAALELLNQHPEPMHLLLTDVVLPGMGGRELAERVRARLPGIKVVFCTGYAEDAMLQRELLARDVSLIQKPFTPTALAWKVREVLDG